jgi:hypothetical protein
MMQILHTLDGELNASLASSNGQGTPGTPFLSSAWFREMNEHNLFLGWECTENRNGRAVFTLRRGIFAVSPQWVITQETNPYATPSQTCRILLVTYKDMGAEFLNRQDLDGIIKQINEDVFNQSVYENSDDAIDELIRIRDIVAPGVDLQKSGRSVECLGLTMTYQWPRNYYEDYIDGSLHEQEDENHRVPYTMAESAFLLKPVSKIHGRHNTFLKLPSFGFSDQNRELHTYLQAIRVFKRHWTENNRPSKLPEGGN